MTNAVMDFMMTYGWVILVVLSAIGGLAYFGVLSTDRFYPDYGNYTKCETRNSIVSKIYCLNELYNELDLESCEESAFYYNYLLNKLHIDNIQIYTDNHVFNIAYDDDFYCIIDMDFIQCVTISKS